MDGVSPWARAPVVFLCNEYAECSPRVEAKARTSAPPPVSPEPGIARRRDWRALTRATDGHETRLLPFSRLGGLS